MSQKISEVATELRNALKKKLIVQFSRPFEPGTFVGYVMGVGPKFFVLASFGDGFAFEQFVCLRMKDVRRLECPAKRTAFYAAARRLRGDKLPRTPKLDLTDISSILHAAAPSLLAIHREKIDPDVCHIGFCLSDNKKFVELIEIDPDAQWESAASYYRLKDITRVDLPGPYEKALLAVGGYPEALRKKTS